MFNPRVFVYDPDSVYRDQIVSVKLPSDGLLDDEKALELLSGPCITVKEGKEKDEKTLPHL